jgi:hypothetical protein
MGSFQLLAENREQRTVNSEEVNSEEVKSGLLKARFTA